MLQHVALLLSLLLAAGSLEAQAPVLKPFQVSPACTLSQDLGISTVTVSYHRPLTRGRSIWGELVPRGEVWRAGANDATTLTLSHPATIDGKVVLAGTYALFVIPDKDQWTWILNRQAKQWGAYAYRREEDVLRLVAPVRRTPHQEALRIDLEPVGEGTLRLELRWEQATSGFDIHLDVRGIYWAHLEATLTKADPKAWAPWFQAASYCWQQGIHLDRAHDWLDISLRAQETYRNLELKARFLHRLGKGKEALKVLSQAIGLAEGKTPKEYLDGLHQLEDAWKRGPEAESICPKCLE